MIAVSFDEARDLDDDRRSALLGAKGAGLVSLRDEAPIPDGFVLTTDAGRHRRAHGWDDRLEGAFTRHLADLERRGSTRVGGGTGHGPLLVGVRSAGTSSMPGALRTILNVGATPEAIDALAGIGGRTFAADTLARAERSWADATETPRPSDPVDQVRRAIQVVFDATPTWGSAPSGTRPAAAGARGTTGLAAPAELSEPAELAVIVQTMVFGNRDDRSATGAIVSRDPVTGAPGVVGSVVVTGQGPDVMSGTSTTESFDVLVERWPDAGAELVAIAARAERRFRDMVELEFTIESGRLWILQCRPSMRSAAAARRVAVDLAEAPTFPLTRAEAVDRVAHLITSSPPAIRTEVAGEVAVDATPARASRRVVIARGEPASPGQASGVLVTDPDEALRRGDAGEAVVLARPETTPADMNAIGASVALFATRGGLVSHAAVVARAWGIPAVVGARDAVVDTAGVSTDAHTVPVGAVVTIDGSAGTLSLGAPPPAESAGPSDPSDASDAVLRRWAASGPAGRPADQVTGAGGTAHRPDRGSNPEPA